MTWPSNPRSTPQSAIAPRHFGHSFVQAITGLHEVLLGRPTLAIAEKLEESQWQSREWHASAQSELLRSLVEHARARCPYYQKVLPDADIRSLSDLTRLPLLTRSVLRQQCESMTWRGAPQKILLGHTHGTIDEPVRYYWDRDRQAWDKANRIRGHAWHGFQTGDRELHVWPIDPPRAISSRFKQWLRKCRDSITAESQVDILSPQGQSSVEFAEALRKFDPIRLTAYPSALCELLLDARRRRQYLESPSLRYVFLTGEVTFEWQRRLIELMLHAPVVQSYGLQEAGALSFACEFGRWHVSAESAVIEIVRRNRPAEPGELGEVVVTGLMSHTMPMIRYCTGDLVRTIKPVECPCGRGLPTMPPVIGRVGDFLVNAQGEWLPSANVIAAMSDIIEPGRFQMRQGSDGNVTILVVASEFNALSQMPKIVRRAKDVFGCRQCVVQMIPCLPRSLYGKCRYVHSELTSPGLASA